jgi:hypothetical protein
MSSAIITLKVVAASLEAIPEASLPELVPAKSNLGLRRLLRNEAPVRPRKKT